jgi:hypothetical protein
VGADLPPLLAGPTLIWHQRHLVHVLREYERFYNFTDRIKASRTAR